MRVAAETVSDTSPASGSDRTADLETAGYNVVNIHPDRVPYDLMTDSWTELATSQMTERMEQIRQAADFSDGNNHIRDVFGFEHAITVCQGRAAEAWFWRAAAKKDAKVVQNLLFPTTRHHLVMNRMTPVELPAPHVFTDKTDIFRGNIDCSRLRALLAEPDGSGIGFIYIEAENNASGGYAVSLSNVRELRKLASDHGIQMVLDATRLVENAVLIQRHEPGYSNHSIRDIYAEFCGFFDHLTCSLAKDFGLTRGGIIATRDERLFYRAADMVATYGPGINVTDKAMVNAAMKDWSFIEKAGQLRVVQVERLHHALVEAGIPVRTPASGHCILVDCAEFMDVSSYRNPVVAFTAAIYEKSGVRGGLHVSGMMKEYALPTAVRFAVPLCTPDELVNEMIPGFVSVLASIGDLPDMEKTTSMPGIHGHMRARYRPVSPGVA